MFRKLDNLIIKAFIGPFIATFFITLMVLVMQFFWLWIDDFVGKGLGADIVLKFIWYQSAVLIPLALPLAILLSSLMTFGNLGESFELVAIKSAGISLLRFMRPLFVISCFIGFAAFLFSNHVIPVAYLKSRTLLSDIVYAKPAFDLKEGVFYDKIGGFVIKIGKKEANDSIIRDVIVYEQNNTLQDNFIMAKSGIMRVSDDSRFLEFNLRDGWHYQERGDNNYGNATPHTDYIRMGFKEYRKKFDLSSFQIFFTADSNNRNNERVYSIRQLNIAIDSIRKENNKIRTQLYAGIYTGLTFINNNDTFERIKPDTLNRTRKQPDSLAKIALARNDSLFNIAQSMKDLIPDSARTQVYQRSQSQVSAITASFSTTQQVLKDKERAYRKHKIEWHRKIVLSLACVVLFMIGAPLGSIIRKGGLGAPMIAAIAFFMLFYFSNTMGEKMAKEGTVSPFVGMWMAVFILVPIGLFLTYKAMHDSQLFNKEWYHRVTKSIKKFRARRLHADNK